MTSPDTNPQSASILRETEKRVQGSEITIKKMKSGYVINNACVVRYIGLGEGGMKMGLYKLTDGSLGPEQVVTIVPYNRYEYINGDQTHFYLWYGRQKGKNPAFIIMSRQFIQASAKIGIDFSAKSVTES